MFLDEVFSGTLQIAAIKPDLDKPNPKLGVSMVEFSADNRYMFSKNGSYKLNHLKFYLCFFLIIV